MKVVVDAGQVETRARASIVLYGHSMSELQYAMIHPILGERGEEKLGAGQPLTVEGLNAAVISLAQAQAGFQASDFLPDNVLSVSPVHLAWWRRPGYRTVFFRTKGEEFSFTAPHPGLIMVASGRDLLIGALRGNERPTAETPVFQPPYFNVWTGGRMCVGNVSLPGDTVASRIAAWEDAFFNSWFTHPNTNNMVQHPGDLEGLWQELYERRGEPLDFPQDVLVPMGKTAKQFAASLQTGSRA